MKMGRNFSHVFCVVFALLYYGMPRASAVINGHDAKPGEFKYLVTFWNSTLHLCGGAILDEWHVVTATHCVFIVDKTLHTSPITLVAGTTNFKSNESTTFRTTVEKFYVTDRYNHSHWLLFFEGPLDDIAVLKVRDKFNLQENPHLAAIQLPDHINSPDAYANKTVQFAGYGYQYINTTVGNGMITETGNTTGQLTKSPMLVVPRTDCLLEYIRYMNFNPDAEEVLDEENSQDEEGTTGLSEVTTEQSTADSPSSNSTDDTISEVLRDYQLCARMTDHGLNDSVLRGLCSGDSGTPLVDGNTVIGVVSFSGFGCDERIVPTVFTMVSHYLDFINNAMNDTVVEGMRMSTILPTEHIPVPYEKDPTRVYFYGTEKEDEK